MGRGSKKNRVDDSELSSPSESDTDASDHRSRRRSRHRKGSKGSSTGEKERKREKRGRDRERRRKGKDRDRDGEGDRKRRTRNSRTEGKRKRSREASAEDASESLDSGSSEPEKVQNKPEAIVGEMLREFPDVGNDLKQLLQMIDDGQAVDIKGISERSLIRYLKKLFLSLNLKEHGDRVFVLPSKARPTLEVVGPLLHSSSKSNEKDNDVSVQDKDFVSVNVKFGLEMDDSGPQLPSPADDSAAPRRRTIGPEMPSAELLAAAAKLTDAEAELREAELEDDIQLFIGPPPPAVVSEAESANEAERFEEVTRIMAVEDDSPYDVLGTNRNMSAENIKKRYWKLSLLVHPDKCSHPQANQAFIRLNKAFKELQDPDKRKALDEKIKIREEKEEFKAELQAMREAAQWRRLQGISMEGDDELLAACDVKEPPKRDEWMTALPPERKPGVTMQTTKFSRSSKEGRGDTSVWTDTPADRAQKAKMNYLEAYNEAAAIASNEKAERSEDADLVDRYNKEKRSKSLVQKHQEDVVAGRMKRKSKPQPEKEEWVGQHPWKPWDREKDLVAGRQAVKFDAEDMSKGLSSRFSSGSFQRNFL